MLLEDAMISFWYWDKLRRERQRLISKLRWNLVVFSESDTAAFSLHDDVVGFDLGATAHTIYQWRGLTVDKLALRKEGIRLLP